MKKLLIRRLLAAIVVLLLASVLVFALSRMSGDPRHLFLSEYTTDEQWEQWGETLDSTNRTTNSTSGGLLVPSCWILISP